MKITLFAGDLTDAPAEALCTSTNARLTLMMGTGGAVREKGGWDVLRACEAIVNGRQLPAGSVHVTTAGKLPQKGVIHCVASAPSQASSEPIIRACTKNALAAADANGFATVAMPVFASGHVRFKFDRALTAMIEVLRTAETNVREVVIVVEPEREADARRLLSAS